MSYVDNLGLFVLPTLRRGREDICKKLFSQIASNLGYNLAHLLPRKTNECYTFRRTWKFVTSLIKTDIFFIIFITDIPSSIDAEHRKNNL